MLPHFLYPGFNLLNLFGRKTLSSYFFSQDKRFPANKCDFILAG